MKQKYLLLTFLPILVLAGGCKKYLDAKSDQSLVLISSQKDLQSVMDQWFNINWQCPGADEASTDEYYLLYPDYLSLSLNELRNLYIWKGDHVINPISNIGNDWSLSYNVVYIANTVLANIDQVPYTPATLNNWKDIKGQAFFLRAHLFYKIASIWAPAFDSLTAAKDLGIPLRLDPDFNKVSVRASVKETYEQIISDLQQAISCLPNSAVHVYRPSKPAAYALLSRVYLSMRNYDLAGKYADSCLQINHSLMDFNDLDSTSDAPIPPFNPEILYDAQVGGNNWELTASGIGRIDSNLYSGYAANDLRKPNFFYLNSDGTPGFKGSYDGSYSQFCGLSTDEVYITRAEAYARQGNNNAALSDLNSLLITRYAKGTYIPYTIANVGNLLNRILAERQKELVMRGTRWMDLKRLNREGAGITPQRILNGITYPLPPNDPRYALAIPEDIINLSGIPQNPR